MDRYVITAGSLYTDIDVLACAYAYFELLKAQGIEATIVLPGQLNSSIPQEIREWTSPFTHTEGYQAAANDHFVLVDISDPSHMAPFVKPEQVAEVYDHHHGYESFWRERLGKQAKIEKVGSCATLIWEEYVRLGLENTISPTSAKLLLTSILSNTLDFRASVTTERDRTAFEQLKSRGKLAKDWRARYFNAVGQSIIHNPLGAVQSDTKEVELYGLPYRFAQLELWDVSPLLRYTKGMEEAKAYLNDISNGSWLISIPCISEGKNYLIWKGDFIREALSTCVELEIFQDGEATTKRLYLRKELLRLFSTQRVSV